MSGEPKRPFLYVVVCAAGVAGEVDRLITAAQGRGWDVGVVATPLALGFFDQAAVEARTGYPIRSAWRKPGDVRPLPPPDAIAVAPATFNTINKWAAGIADTLALGILCEAYGLGVPTAVLPAVNRAMAAHPAYADSLARLRAMGVRFPFAADKVREPEGELAGAPDRASDRAPVGKPDRASVGKPAGAPVGAGFRWEDVLELLAR